MGRLIGIVLVVAAIYLTANYVTGARKIGDEEVDARSVPQRAGDAVRDAFADGEQRREKLLPE